MYPMKFMFTSLILFFSNLSTNPSFLSIMEGAPSIATEDKFDKGKSYFSKVHN